MAPRRTTPSIRIEYNRGLHLMGTVLWFDAVRRADLCFLSHAHLRQAAPHRKILATPATAALVRPRLHKARTLVCPYHRPFALGELGLMLIPAGHIAGSAQLVVEYRSERLIYTGHFSLSVKRCCPAAEVLAADVLLAHAAFPPRWRLPPKEDEERALLAWATEARADGAIPALLCAELGKAQEIAKLLLEHGFVVRAERRIFDACRRMEAGAGVRFDGLLRARKSPAPGEVVLAGFSPSTRTRLRKNPRVRLAAATGMALQPGYCQQAGVDRAFALSLHADFSMIEEYLLGCGPREVYLFGPGAEETAGVLARKRKKVRALLPPEQLSLPLPKAGLVAS